MRIKEEWFGGIYVLLLNLQDQKFSWFSDLSGAWELFTFHLRLSVLSFSSLDGVSSTCRCWDANRLLVNATAAEEDQEHAAKFSSSIKLHANRNWLFLCKPVLAGHSACIRHQTQLSALSYWLNWAEMGDKTCNWPGLKSWRDFRYHHYYSGTQHNQFNCLTPKYY